MPSRERLIIHVRRLFLLASIGACCAILAYAFEDRTRGRFISQMNDAGEGGTLILLLVLAAALCAGASACLHGRHVAGLLRFAVAVLVWIIMSTNASAGDHAGAYFGVLLLYGMISIFSIMTLASVSELFAAVAIPLAFAVIILITGQLGQGPTGQKIVLMGFLCVECLNVCVCFPQRLAWFDGIDGT